MRFRIIGTGWRIGDALVPADTIIDASAKDRWSKLARGLTPPLSAQPLDREALEAQVAAYPDAKHLLSGAWL